MKESDIELSDIMAKIDIMYKGQGELKLEVNKIRSVVIGNGDEASILNKIQRLQFNADAANKDREGMAVQLVNLTSCVRRLERDGINETHSIEGLSDGQADIIERLDKMEATQEEQGTLIQAFRNRVIGIVAVLSLLAGAGVGFATAAKLLSTAVP